KWGQLSERSALHVRNFARNLLSRLQLVPEATVRERQREAAEWGRRQAYIYGRDFLADVRARYPELLTPPSSPPTLTLSTGTWTYDARDPRCPWGVAMREAPGMCWTKRPKCDTPEDYEAVAKFLRHQEGT